MDDDEGDAYVDGDLAIAGGGPDYDIGPKDHFLTGPSRITRAQAKVDTFHKDQFPNRGILFDVINAHQPTRYPRVTPPSGKTYTPRKRCQATDCPDKGSTYCDFCCKTTNRTVHFCDKCHVMHIADMTYQHSILHMRNANVDVLDHTAYDFGPDDDDAGSAPDDTSDVPPADDDDNIDDDEV